MIIFITSTEMFCFELSAETQQILSLSVSVLMVIFQANLVSQCLLKQRMTEVVVTTELLEL